MHAPPAAAQAAGPDGASLVVPHPATASAIDAKARTSPSHSP